MLETCDLSLVACSEHSDSIRASAVRCRPVGKFSCLSATIHGLVQRFTDLSKRLGIRRMMRSRFILRAHNVALTREARTWCFLLGADDVIHVPVCKGESSVIMLKILGATVQN